MAEGFYKATVSLPFVGGLPEDVSQNSFYFGCNDAGSSNAEDATIIQARLASFYNDINTGATEAIAEKIGEQVDRGANQCTVAYYFTDDLEPPALWGSPVETRSFTLAAADSGDPLPAEVSLCLSYHADLTDVPETQTNPSPPPAIIRPAARLRGRIYIGPLQDTAGTTGGPNNDWVPNSSTKNAWAAGGDFLLGANDADIQWAGASRAGELFYVVDGGYVDDAFDTQRRRGSAPTSRLTFGS